MAQRERRGATVLVLAAVLAGAVSASAGGAASPAETSLVAAGHSVSQPAAAVRAYWTPARMRRALDPAGVLRAPGSSPPAAAPAAPPAYVPPAVPGEVGARLIPGLLPGEAGSSAFSPGEERAYPNRLHGRVFFTVGASDFACSGTAVNSPARSLVVSAGHCAFDGREWSANWLFVPGYRDGRAPFGRWPARTLRAPRQWVNDENISFDVSIATVARNRDGRALQDVIGARGIGFNQPRDLVYTAYGYPAGPPFDGESLFACRSRYAGDDSSTDPPRTMRINCDMNQGASGGGWVAREMVLSVNSYCTGLILVCLDTTSLYGPYFGGAAQELYLRSRGRAARCAGARVTQLGGAGADSLRGRAGRDVISLAAGADTGSGRGGRDLLCGGTGDDTLRGGPGRDVCIGGPGRDSARGCEVRRQVEVTDPT